MEQRNCPYWDVPETSLWKPSVADLAPDRVAPFVEPVPLISTTSRVASAGSCFAQHISRHLRQWGYNYFVTEAGPPWLSQANKARHAYGAYSARFGNIYTARQLRQLAERSFGRFAPDVPVWPLPSDRVADPFRPRIEPEGFVSTSECLRDRDLHLAGVREMFEHLDVLIFTLGLTEGWRHRATGAMLPVCPGCGAGGTFDAREHEFVNFTVAEVVEDLECTLDLLSSANPEAQVIFTVSPVPLVATFEDRHVLPATVYSKSVLRVAAEEVTRNHANVHYFASYEMVSALREPDTFQADGRQVNEHVVARVMRVFARQFCTDVNIQVSDEAQAAPTSEPDHDVDADLVAQEVLCDEDVLIEALARDRAAQ